MDVRPPPSDRRRRLRRPSAMLVLASLVTLAAAGFGLTATLGAADVRADLRGKFPDATLVDPLPFGPGLLRADVECASGFAYRCWFLWAPGCWKEVRRETTSLTCFWF